MSRTHTAQPSPYPRENFFGDDTDDAQHSAQTGTTYGTGDGPQTNPGPAGTWHSDPNDPSAYLAHALLRESGRLLCAATLHEPPDRGWTPHMIAEGIEQAPGHDPDALHRENREVELSDPAVRPPTETVGNQRHRKRVNEEHGYLSGGLSTGVWIQDRPEEDLLEIVREWLDGRHGDLREFKRQQAIDRARRLKRQGQKRDVEILEHVVEMVRADDFDHSRH